MSSKKDKKKKASKKDKKEGVDDSVVDKKKKHEKKKKKDKKGGVGTLTTRAGDHLQKDWEERDWIETVQADMQRIVAFLNQFEASSMERFSRLNDALEHLEHQMDYLEARAYTAVQANSKG